jgi:hypothetical protein
MAVQDGTIRDFRPPLPEGLNQALPAPVPRGFLTVLETPKSTAYAITDEESGRLELANWLVNPQNPLPPRVAVNRIWSHLFGKGLVSTPDEFGAAGDPPSHPELLDYLARRFVADGWSFKKLIRALVLTRTYQMSSEAPARAEGAPDNRLLSHMNRRELGWGVVRDAALAASGQLNRSLGGPAVPFSTPARYGVRNLETIQSSSLRRSIYLPVIRSELGQPRLTSLERSLSSTNSPFLAARSRQLTEKLLGSLASATDQQRSQELFKQVLGRAPAPEETAWVIETLRKALSKVAPSREIIQERTRQTWESICHDLLLSSEFRTVH